MTSSTYVLEFIECFLGKWEKSTPEDIKSAEPSYILQHINADLTPSTTLQAKVADSELGFKSGKGFLEWSEEAISESRQRLANCLIAVFSEQQK